MKKVLIETLWNVKQNVRLRSANRNNVLIETLWNVKIYMEEMHMDVLSINRNIVECKVARL